MADAIKTVLNGAEPKQQRIKRHCEFRTQWQGEVFQVQQKAQKSIMEAQFCSALLLNV